MSRSVGRRFERLLFFAGPLSLVCLLTFFVSLAIKSDEPRIHSKCLRDFSEIIKSNLASLNSDYKIQQRYRNVKKKEGSQALSNPSEYYALSIRLKITDEFDIQKRCGAFVEQNFPISAVLGNPVELMQQLQAKAYDYDRGPFSLFGIKVPERTSVSILGTNIEMEVTTLATLLKISLGPILFLWLGSLYHTRKREALFIGRMKDLGELYPHVVNLYPINLLETGSTSGFRRRSWTAYIFGTYVRPIFYAGLRMLVMLMFIGPSVFAYVLSIYYSEIDGLILAVQSTSALMVLTVALGIIFEELQIFHVFQRFSVKHGMPI